jgi:signal transduction histidine kinase
MARAFAVLFKVVGALLLIVIGMFVAITLFLAALPRAHEAFFGEELVDYEVVETMVDKNGFVIELASEAEQLAGSIYYSVHIYDDINPARTYAQASSLPVITISGVSREPAPKLSFDGKCYILSANYRSNWPVEPVWREWFGSRELCFELRKVGEDESAVTP